MMHIFIEEREEIPGRKIEVHNVNKVIHLRTTMIQSL